MCTQRRINGYWLVLIQIEKWKYLSLNQLRNLLVKNRAMFCGSYLARLKFEFSEIHNISLPCMGTWSELDIWYWHGCLYLSRHSRYWTLDLQMSNAKIETFELWNELRISIHVVDILHMELQGRLIGRHFKISFNHTSQNWITMF